jgi:hypothetical protein
MSWSGSQRRWISRTAVLLALAGALCQGVMVVAGYMTGLVDRLMALSAVVAATFILAVLAGVLSKKTDISHSGCCPSPRTPA